MTTVQARHIKNIPWGGVANQGQAILFKLTFHDGSQEDYGCEMSLLPLLMANLSQYANMAEAVRVKAPPRSLSTASPYRVTNVNRSGHTPDGKMVSIEYQTNYGFPLGIAMTPDQARQTIEFLQREILLAAGPRSDDRH